MAGGAYYYDFHDGSLVKRDERIVLYNGPASMFDGTHVCRLPRLYNHAIAGVPGAKVQDYGLRPLFGGLPYMSLEFMFRAVTRTNPLPLIGFCGAPLDPVTGLACALVVIDSADVVTVYWKAPDHPETDLKKVTKTVTGVGGTMWQRWDVCLSKAGRVLISRETETTPGSWTLIVNSNSDPVDTIALTDLSDYLSTRYMFVLNTDADWIDECAPTTDISGGYAPGSDEVDWAVLRFSRTYTSGTARMRLSDIKWECRFGQPGYISTPYELHPLLAPDLYGGSRLLLAVGGNAGPDVDTQSKDAELRMTTSGKANYKMRDYGWAYETPVNVAELFLYELPMLSDALGFSTVVNTGLYEPNPIRRSP